MVFLVGVRRSGTNWLARMLGVHPDVVVLPSETHLISHGIPDLQRHFQHGLPTSPHTGTVFLDHGRFLDLTRDLCDAAFKAVAEAIRPDAQLILEHTPMNLGHLALIGELYPDATVLHLIRDGRDVARSLMMQDWGPRSVDEAAREWRDGIESARAAAHPLRSYHEVRYEDILADPAREVARIFELLGLTAGDDVAEEVSREAEVAFNTDRRDPRVGQGKWRTAWSSTDGAAFGRAAGALLSELGYGPAGTGPPGPDRSRKASLTASAGRQLGRSLGGARRRASGFRARIGAHRLAPGHQMDRYQGVVDRFFGHLAAGRRDAAAALLSPSARVRVVTHEGARERRGAGAGPLLVDALEGRSSVLAGASVPLHSEVVIVVDEFVVLLTSRGADGAPVDEMFILRVTGDGLVHSIRYFRFPLAGAPPSGCPGAPVEGDPG